VLSILASFCVCDGTALLIHHSAEAPSSLSSLIYLYYSHHPIPIPTASPTTTSIHQYLLPSSLLRPYQHLPLQPTDVYTYPMAYNQRPSKPNNPSKDTAHLYALSREINSFYSRIGELSQKRRAINSSQINLQVQLNRLRNEEAALTRSDTPCMFFFFFFRTSFFPLLG